MKALEFSYRKAWHKLNFKLSLFPLVNSGVVMSHLGRFLFAVAYMLILQILSGAFSLLLSSRMRRARGSVTLINKRKLSNTLKE